MNLFKKLNEMTKGDGTVTIVIKTSKDDNLVVATTFTGDGAESLSPFLVKGKTDELDENYETLIEEAVKTVKEFKSNIEAFKNSAKNNLKQAEAEKKKAENDKKKSEESKSATIEKLKAEAEKKKRLEEKINALIAEGDKAKAQDKANTAIGFYKTALMEVTDEKVKKDLKSKIQALEQVTASFFCADNEKEANDTVFAFLSILTKDEVPVEEEKKPTEETPTEPETEDIAEEDNNNEDEMEF